MTNTHFFVLYKFIKTNYNKSIDREHHQEYEKYKKYIKKAIRDNKKDRKPKSLPARRK